MGQHSFQEVMRQRNRMCKKYWTSRSCHGCPVAEEKHAYEGCRLIDLDPKRYEELVLQWAAEHPEPVYPTWLELAVQQGFKIEEGKQCTDEKQLLMLMMASVNTPIPADIAEKLGIAPKEG